MAWGSFTGGTADAPTASRGTAGSGWGSFSGSPAAPTTNVALKREQQAQIAATSRAKSAQANSVSGLLRATIAGLPAASGIGQAFKSSFGQAVQGYTAASQPGQTLPQFGENVLKTGAGITNTLFSPFAPLTNQVGKIIQYAGDQLAKTGPIASYGRAVANIPNYPQEDTPTRILNAILNASIIGGAIAGAKVGGPKPAVRLPVRDLSPEATSVGIRRPIDVQGTSETTPVNIYHPATPEGDLPAIQLGKIPKSTSNLPTIEAGTARARSTPGGLRYEPISAPETPRAVVERTSSVEAPTAPERPIVEGQRVTKAASDITESLVQQGFARLPAEEQARYTPSTKAEQLSKVAALMRDPVRSEAMVKGDVPLPPEVHTPVFFNAMEAYAHQTGNVQLLRDMAKSPMAEVTSKAAQQLGSAAFNKNDYGPVSMIRKVEQARTTGRQTIRRSEAVVRRVRTVIKKVNTKESWQAFVESITC